MNVRVLGPNLNDQSKGQFHVHASGCKDLRNYGPGRKCGGETHGTRETVLRDATVEGVVCHIYDNGIIDENVADGESREAVIDRLTSDFWFAPCCSDLPHEGVIEETVYECWVSNDVSSFAKLDAINVPIWVTEQMESIPLHQGIHIVGHLKSEYTS